MIGHTSHFSPAAAGIPGLMVRGHHVALDRSRHIAQGPALMSAWVVAPGAPHW